VQASQRHCRARHARDDADDRVDTTPPMLVTGASGGPFIITTVFQAISNRLDYGLGVSALMQAPRLHHQHLPDALRLERNGFQAAEIAELQRLGHDVRLFSHEDDGSIGATIERRDGRWHGQSDPRITGLARGH
jgi:gamma-glutamyltranspeptidase/glutathione hydrolase